MPTKRFNNPMESSTVRSAPSPAQRKRSQFAWTRTGAFFPPSRLRCSFGTRLPNRIYRPANRNQPRGRERGRERASVRERRNRRVSTFPVLIIHTRIRHTPLWHYGNLPQYRIRKLKIKIVLEKKKKNVRDKIVPLFPRGYPGNPKLPTGQQ